ncbi:MAG: hypothetical protein NPINA01_00080 [Nitrospinaceae bacterium]|nr:MAG: hypothetical protein NPINA01_00080 [Nitrospinaceae bacterium]
MKAIFFFTLTVFFCFLAAIRVPQAMASEARAVNILEEKNIEQKIKALSDEWQKQFVEAVNDFLEQELNRLQDKETEPGESLSRQITKYEEEIKRGAGNVDAYVSLGKLYDQKGDGANAIIYTKKAEEIFVKNEDIKGVAEARRKLRIYFEKYDYKPEDFELAK